MVPVRSVVIETVGEAPVAEPLDRWRAECPGCGVLALVAEADRPAAVPLLQALCRGRGIPLRGAVFPALVAGDRFLGHGLVLLRLDVMPFAPILAPLPAAQPARQAAVEELAAQLLARLERPRATALFLVFDAMVPDVASLLDVLYLKLADGVRYFGVNAGSETFRPMPCLFDEEREAQGGVLALLLPGHPGAVVEHGYQAPERTISATATEGNRIQTIDWRPAFEVYQEEIREEYGLAVDRESFYRHAVHFPFGLVRADGEILVRIPVALEDDGSLFCVGEVPANALLTPLRAPAVDSGWTVDRLAQGLATLQGRDLGPESELLAFYCAGRRLHLGERAATELAALAERTGTRRIAGALSLGEIGHPMRWGYPLFHNAAILCCGWGPDEA